MLKINVIFKFFNFLLCEKKVKFYLFFLFYLVFLKNVLVWRFFKFFVNCFECYIKDYSY